MWPPSIQYQNYINTKQVSIIKQIKVYNIKTQKKIKENKN